MENHDYSNAWAAWTHAQQQRQDEAMALLEQLPPPKTLKNARAQALAAATWLQCGHPERGLPYLNGEWADAEPEAAGLAGAMLLSCGRFDAARQALQRAIEGAAQDQGAHSINLGRTLTLMGRAEEALPYFEQGLIVLGEGHSLALRSRAEALITLCRSDEALASLPKISADENQALIRARVLATAGRHEEAAHVLLEAQTQWPDSSKLLLMAAELAEVRGRSGQARAMLNKALDKDPENSALWAQLAQSGRKGQHSQDARAAADKALALSEGKPAAIRAKALHAHAHVLAEEGHSNDAEAVYRDILQMKPGFIPALSGLGHLLMQGGKIEEALQCFEQVRAAAPLQGWSQLIHAREIPDDPQVLADLMRAAHQPSLEGPVRASLLFTVAAALDKKKDHARAMQTAVEANEASKRLISYQAAAHRARVEHQIAQFSEEFMTSRAGWGSTSRLPVFVLGMPRSGTTLTEQILASHSHVFGAGELGQIGELIAKLELWERHVGSGLAYPACVTEMTQPESVTYAKQLLDALTEFSPQAQHIVDKLPHNFEHVGLIKLLFPNAIIFHCQREARDIALSNYMTDYAAKFGGMGFAYDLGWIGEQLVDHDRLMQHWHALFPGQIMEVIYEDLVEDTETWARGMIDFMGLPWEPGVLAFQGLERSVKTASVWQVRQPVYTTSKARWKPYASWLEPLEHALSVIPDKSEPWPLPSIPPGLFFEGMSCLNNQELIQAESCFKQVIAAHPRHAAAHHFLGVALVQMGQRHEGLRIMRLSVRLLPFHKIWLENLATVEAMEGNTEAATKLRARIKH